MNKIFSYLPEPKKNKTWLIIYAKQLGNGNNKIKKSSKFKQSLTNKKNAAEIFQTLHRRRTRNFIIHFFIVQIKNLFCKQLLYIHLAWISTYKHTPQERKKRKEKKWKKDEKEWKER